MRSLVVAVLLAAGTASAGGIQWIEDDWDKAAAEAKKSNRLVHVHWYGSSETTWCKKLAEEAFADESLAAWANETFVNLKMDKDRKADLAARHKVLSVPDTVIVSADGRIVARVPGYRAKDAHFAELKKAVDVNKRLIDAEAALAKDPKDLAAHLAAGRCRIEAWDHAEAEKHFRTVVDEDKDNAKGLAVQAWHGIGEAKAAEGDGQDIPGAKEAFGKVRELDAKNEKGNTDNAAAQLGRLMMGGNPKGAREELEKVVADFPKTDGAAEAMFLVGALLADDGDFDGAAAQMKKLAAEMPDTDWAREVPRALEQIEAMRAHSKKENK